MFTYTYDTANWLATLKQGMALTYTYSYNGMGDRVKQVVNGVPTTYTLDLNAGLTQVLADGTNTYLYGNGRIAQYAGTTPSYFLGDALGSVRQLANASGAVTLARSYQPYGSVMSSAGTGATSYAFAGEWQDATNLLHLRSRYYSLAQGRFLTADTFRGDYRRPLTLNRWNYANGNPINYTDPSGHCWEPIEATICAIAIIAGVAYIGIMAYYHPEVLHRAAEDIASEAEDLIAKCESIVEQAFQQPQPQPIEIGDPVFPRIRIEPDERRSPQVIVELGAGDYSNARAMKKAYPGARVYATNLVEEWEYGERLVKKGQTIPEFFVNMYNGWFFAKDEGVIVGDTMPLENSDVPSGIADLVYTILPYPSSAYSFGVEAARIASHGSGTTIAITAGYASGTSDPRVLSNPLLAPMGSALERFIIGFNSERYAHFTLDSRATPYGQPGEWEPDPYRTFSYTVP